MSHLKNNLVFSSLTILLVTGGSLGLAQSAHNKVSSQKLEAKNVNQVSNYSGDIDIISPSSLLTEPSAKLTVHFSTDSIIPFGHIELTELR